MKDIMELRDVVRIKLFSLIVIGTASAATPAVAQEAPWLIGVDQISRLDLLPAIKRTIKIGAVTSYDRTEGNDDGFSGKYSFIRKEGDGLVIADLKGPGCITRIHTPTPTDDPLEFYFDGESDASSEAPLPAVVHWPDRAVPATTGGQRGRRLLQLRAHLLPEVVQSRPPGAKAPVLRLELRGIS